jgi:NAD-dependent dihydropyrimidine dehydrogenase PreA subunit/flavodoxin
MSYSYTVSNPTTAPKKALIVYGSNRGSTARVSEEIAQGMVDAGADATAISVDLLRLAPGRVAKCDILGIGSPVHFYREARYITTFLESLPLLRGKKAFVFCTCGMDRVGETLNRLHRALTERGAEVVGAESVRSAMSYFPLRRRGLANGEQHPDTDALGRARAFGARMADAGTMPVIPAPPVTRFVSWKAAKLADMRLRRVVFPGVRMNPAKCTGYGQCMTRCLQGGLDRLDGATVPYFTDACVRCLDCIAWCPRGAIEPDSRFKEWLATAVWRMRLH